MVKFRDFALWVVLYAFSVFWIFLFFQRLQNTNDILLLLFGGFIIAILAKVYKVFFYKKEFHISPYLLYATLLDAFALWISILLLSFLGLSTFPFNLILIGIIFESIWQINHKIRKKRKNIATVVIFIILFFSFTHYFILEQDLDVMNTANNFLNDNFFSTFSLNFGSAVKLDPTCPQISVPIDVATMTIPSQTYEDVQIFCYSYRETFLTYTTSCSAIRCSKGIDRNDNEGLHANYIYCGDVKDVTNLAGFEKTLINSDGTIGRTIRRSFMNEYAPDFRYSKTICGSNPDDIISKFITEKEEQAKRELQQMMGDIKDIFG